MHMPLYLAQDADSAWSQCLEPWLQERLQAGHLERIRLVVPSAQHAQLVKHYSLASECPMAGVELFTPRHLRKALQSPGLDTPLATREDLHLLMQISAGRLEDTLPEASMAAQAPTAWVQLYDLLAQSNRPLSSLPAGPIRHILEAFEAQCLKGGLTPLHTHNWRRLQTWQPQEQTPLWFYGLSAADFAHWPLFYAALKAPQARIKSCLWATGDDVWDSLWVELWESTLGTEALWLDPCPPGPFAPGVDSLEVHPTPVALGLPCPHPEAQALAIANQVAHWLVDPACTQIGVIFPTGSSCAPRVSHLLSQQGLLHEDSFGLPNKQSPSYELLNAYLAWQKDPRLTHFEPFLGLLQTQGLLEDSKRAQLQHNLRKRFTACLVEDLEALFKAPSEPLSQLLKDWPILPPKAPLALYWHSLQRMLERLEFSIDALEWIRTQDSICTREAFASWVEGMLRTPGRSPQPQGQHAFARVRLLPWQAALGLCFSHVLIADATQSAWAAPTLPLLDALDLTEPPQAHADSLPLLGNAYTEALQAATLRHLVRTASQGLAISSFLHDTQGQPTTPQLFLSALIAETRLAQAPVQAPRTAAPIEPPKVYHTGQPLILSAKAWEATWHYPEQVWLEHILKSPEEPPAQMQDPSALASGTWVHALLARALSWGRIEATPVRQRFSQALDALWIQRHAHTWELYFDQARAQAQSLLEKLIESRSGYWAAAEVPLPPQTQVLIPGTSQHLPLTGRIDLVLSPDPLPVGLQGLNPESPYEILDFKTGSDPALTLKSLEAGHGLQLALYGLALQAHGAGPNVNLTLLHPYGPWPASLALTHTFGLTALWETLLERYQSGSFCAT